MHDISSIRFNNAIRSANTGTVWLNTWHKYHPNAPFGGYKMSGYGREQGAEALESYTQYKTVWANLGGG
jgi:aldehyde dehydrogenase (NAD+)